MHQRAFKSSGENLKGNDLLFSFSLILQATWILVGYFSDYPHSSCPPSPSPSHTHSFFKNLFVYGESRRNPPLLFLSFLPREVCISFLLHVLSSLVGYFRCVLPAFFTFLFIYLFVYLLWLVYGVGKMMQQLL